jgi:hypothetical protein
MFRLADVRHPADEFARHLDEAKALAVVLRRQAVREFGASFFAAAAAALRRLAQAARTSRPPMRRAAPTAR